MDDYGFKQHCQFKQMSLDLGINDLRNLIEKNCILCDAFSNQNLCHDCLKSLPRIPANHCPTCSKYTPFSQDQKCGACLFMPPAFTTTVAAFNYAFPIDALIHTLKYKMQLAIAPILAELLIDKLRSQASTEPPDLIVPMPLHSKRLQERGFNQALEISRYVARKMNITLSSHSCKRIKNTPPQIGLPWKARKKNVQNAFRCMADLSGKHVAVIDDVMTTGASLNALAQQLRKQGATKISNWIIARAQADQFRTHADFNF